MARILLAYVSDVPEGKGIVVYGSEGQEIALFNVNGDIYALDNACPHMEGPLGEGDVKEGCVTCPWHAWQFDLKTGACINMPGDDATVIDVVVKDGTIYLEE